MGCASSKSVDVSSTVADVYRPPPTSIAVFDINTVEEPWLITTTTTVDQEKQAAQLEAEQVIKKPTHVSIPILEKLEKTAANGDDVSPQLSWSEVSKALEDLKPSLDQKPAPPHKPTSLSNTTARDNLTPPPELTGRRPVKENSFLIRDRLEREGVKGADADAAKIKWRRPDPLEGYPERPPPGNADGVVLYTTSLRGVRRTFEDCEWARRIVYPNALETGVEVDERDVSLHGEFLKEMRELLLLVEEEEEEEGGGHHQGVVVPRLFVMGRYVGGIEKMVEVNEDGRMREMMRWVRKKIKGGHVGGKGGWGVECEGCGGARFVPCIECSGSCKVVDQGKEVMRCDKCNENGLVMCPICH